MHIKNTIFSVLLLASSLATWAAQEKPLRQAQDRPNIIYILADDLGYGDVQTLNPERGKIPTPHMDQLRAQGMAFTDCHSNSSVCTPTRYGILTGRYAWRKKAKGVLSGMSGPMIAQKRLTVGELLQQNGYTTAAIGKWHLGMKFNSKDYTKPVTDGPLQHGFDYYFGIPASLDMPPYAYIENDRFTQVASARKSFPSFSYGKVKTKGPARAGPAAPDFEAVNVLPDLTEKAVEYIGQRSSEEKPFFIYLALPSPHTPVVPSKEWQGKSGMGAYGDFVMQTDWVVGEVMKAVDANGLTENTMIIVTSDNGCAPYVGVKEMEAIGHYPSAQFRGYKTQIWEGGHRVPFLVRWPAKVKAGSESTQLTCVTDLMATCAEILGAEIPDSAGEDSVSILPALLGTDSAPLREAVVHHSFRGAFAIRQGDWKLALGSGGGGSKIGDNGDKASPQLYNLKQDIGETNNLAKSNPEVVERLTKLLQQYAVTGRSTPGEKQANDIKVKIGGR